MILFLGFLITFFLEVSLNLIRPDNNKEVQFSENIKLNVSNVNDYLANRYFIGQWTIMNNSKT